MFPDIIFGDIANLSLISMLAERFKPATGVKHYFMTKINVLKEIKEDCFVGRV